MDDREELIRGKIRNEDFAEMAHLEGTRENMRDFLIREKGFIPAEIEINPVFRIELAKCNAEVSIDLAINLSGMYFMVIKCIAGAVESWERYVISFARAVKEYQIPYAAIADGKNIRIFDAISGSFLSESATRLFDRSEALDIIRDFKKIDRSEKSLEKERRIIYAFESIKCPSLEKEE